MIMLGLLFSIPYSFAQQINVGAKPIQNVTITIDENGTAHVVHSVVGSKTLLQVETYNGTMTNLSVTGQDGKSVEYLTMQKAPPAIIIPPTSRNMTLIKYDLVNVVTQTDGVWKWNFVTPPNTDYTDLNLPKNIDIVWVNDRPVYIGDKGIRHHGDSMRLEYAISEPVVLKDVDWENKKFTVAIKTLAKVDTFDFSQSEKSFSFHTDKKNSLTTVIMPLELLWEPYQVKINTNKTLTNVFHSNGTHAWIGFRPHISGTVHIIGTTVIPEFPLFVPLALAISAVIVLQFKNRLIFR